MIKNLNYPCIILSLLLTATLFVYKTTEAVNHQQPELQVTNKGISSKKARECFISNYKTNSILVFDADGSGNISPLREIKGMNQPSGIALEKESAELYVADSVNNSVGIYDKHADGNATPRRSISGPQTKLDRPEGIAVNAVDGEIYIANLLSKSITVYPISARGDVKPLRIIQGKDTYLIGPMRIAFDAKHNEILIINRDHQRQRYNVISFDKSANGNVKPKRVILTTEVSSEGEIWPEGIAIDDRRNEILITNLYQAMPDTSESYIEIYKRNGNDVVGPSKIIVNQGMDVILVDNDNKEVFVADSMQNTISVYQRDQIGKVDPIRVIRGAATRLSYPTSIAVSIK